MYNFFLWWGLRSYFLVIILFSMCSEAIHLGHGVINTTYGPVKGKSIDLPTGKQVVQFLGIPYASADRFKRPKPPAIWNTTLDVTKYGKSCPQQTNVQPFDLKPEDISEDCLNLNVFAPNSTGFREKSASNPVLVWLHGGVFVMGTSTTTDASTIATEGDIVVVTVNYRLGALGFLSIKEDELAGNYAVFDVIEALRWVQNNIEGFGGDPRNVTLGGWSAGARLVGVLMMSPHANGLYERVLMMSGTAGGLYSYLEQEEADQRAQYFGGLLRCPHPSSDFKDCMRRKSTAQYIEAQDKTHPSDLLAQWAPVVDGDVLLDSPPKLLEQGTFNGSSVLIGVANDDGSNFLNDLTGVIRGVDVTKGLTREVFKQVIGNKTWIRNQDNKVPPIIAFQYTDWATPNDLNGTRRQYLDLLTDAIYRAPAVRSADAFAKKGIPVFFYQTEYRENNDVTGKLIPAWLNIPHRGDLRYIFPKPIESSVSGFTLTMMQPWIYFIKFGIPYQPTNPPNWPHYTIKDQKYLALKSFPAPESKLRVDKMKFWNEFLPKNGKADEQPTSSPTTSPPDDTADLTIALIVISFFFVVVLIIILILLIVLYGRGKKTPKNQSSYIPPPKKPLPPKEEPSYQTPHHTPSPPYESPGPYQNSRSMYDSSFKYVEKPNSSPTLYRQDYSEGRIEFVDERDSSRHSKGYLDSDML